jgi:hypothetical protein
MNTTPFRPFLFCAAGLLLLVAVRAPAPPVSDDGFVSMFNGKDLSGWEGMPDGWTVRDGILIGESTPEKPCTRSHYLYWKGAEPSEFEMRFSWRLTGEANSGVQFRSEPRSQWDTWGFQADMDSAGAYIGALYHHARGLVAQRGEKVVIDASGGKSVSKFAEADELLKSVRKGEWNTYRILAQGRRLSLWINDELMCEAVIHDPKLAASRNLIALQMHQGPPMKAEFKDLWIRTGR